MNLGYKQFEHFLQIDLNNKHAVDNLINENNNNMDLFTLPMKYWDGGSNCAQATACGLLDFHNYQDESKVLNSTFINFGVGLGEGDICGAIFGCLGAIGFILHEEGLGKERIMNARNNFKENIRNVFNSLKCKDFLDVFRDIDGEIDWDHPEREKKCIDIVKTAFKTAIELIKTSKINALI